MDIISNSLSPIETLAGFLSGNTVKGLNGSSGCPLTAKCTGCVPFCCYPAVDPQNFIIKNDVVQYWQLSKTLLFSLVPDGQIGSVIFDLLSYITNYVNSVLNKKRNAEEQQQIINATMQFITYFLQGLLECRIGWCRVLDNLASSRDFAPNSPVFGDKGPDVMRAAMKIYIKAANEANNNRYGKTSQTILDIAASYDNDLPENDIEARRLMIKVPNIEHYWQHDVILVPNTNGSTTELLVKHRSGYSKEYTPDCDMTVINNTVVPSGIYDGGRRGCQMGITQTFQGRMTSLGSANSGLNIRNLVGEGYLVTDKAYDSFSAAFLSNLKGKQVSLKNPVYITVDQNTPPPTITPSTTPPITSSGSGTTKTTTNLLQIPQQWLQKIGVASFGSLIAQIALISIGVGLVYNAFDDKGNMQKPEKPNKQ